MIINELWKWDVFLFEKVFKINFGGYICIIIHTKTNHTMYHVLFYKKGEGGCQMQCGFQSREKAVEWLKTFWDDIDWYSIEKTGQ